MGSTSAASPTLQCQATRGNRCSTSSGGGDTSGDDARLARLHQLPSPHSRGRPARRKRKRWSVSCLEASALEKACRCHSVGETQARPPQTLWLLQTSLKKTFCDFIASVSHRVRFCPFCAMLRALERVFAKTTARSLSKLPAALLLGFEMQMLAPLICLEGP